MKSGVGVERDLVIAELVPRDRVLELAAEHFVVHDVERRELRPGEGLAEEVEAEQGEGHLGGAVADRDLVGALVALDAKTGVARWTQSAGGSVIGSSTVIGNVVYVNVGVANNLPLASAFAFITLYAAIERIGSSRAAVAAMIEPIATLILASILLDEVVTTRVLIGALLVLSALPLLALAGKREIPTADPT